jgi:hypothetical protein
MIETITDQDKVLVRYLFNEMDETEIVALEDKMLLDDELFERVRVVEMNLIDGYVRDEMTTEESLRFKEKFLAVPENIDKVNHARMFHQSMRLLHEEEQVAPQTIRKQNRHQWLAGLFQRPRAALAFTAIALVFIVTLYAVYLYSPNRSGTANENSIAGSSVPPIPDNVNTGTDNTSNSSLAVNAPGSQQRPPLIQSVNKESNIHGIETAKNDPGKYTQSMCLNCDQRGGERGVSNVSITLGKQVKNLNLMYELLKDAPERDTYGVTIKDKGDYPIRLKNNQEKEEVKPVKIKLRTFLIVSVPTRALKDSGPYYFEIDDQYFLPKSFTIKR